MMSDSKATQDFVPIREVRDGVAILKDGSLRAIVMTSALNFALKSNDEQQAIIFQFQNFLNSLDFSVQFCIQSRRLDIKPYLLTLEENFKSQTNDLLKIQTREYIDFIRSFTENVNIMTKTFFVVIPYTPPILEVKKTHNIFKKQSNEEKVTKEREDFEEYRTQLDQRISIVEQGIIRCGIRVAKLGTEEIIEVFHKLFNPSDVEKPVTIKNQHGNI